jgi:2-polyprenyl-6-methoxyphenol hydroxylase-like FAD-dependent oxidoreductase
LNCSGSGLVAAISPPIPDTENYPHVAIIGGGIGGVALAVACLHRGFRLPFTNAITKLDLRAMDSLCNKLVKQSKDCFLIRRRSNFHQTFGSYYRWKSDRGMGNEKMDAVRGQKSQSEPIYARQSLRFALLEQLGGHDKIKWGHQLVDLKEVEGETVELSFEVSGEVKIAKADLVVGADGIRSSVRKLLIGDSVTPCVTSIVL